jgi:hypothetical protein
VLISLRVAKNNWFCCFVSDPTIGFVVIKSVYVRVVESHPLHKPLCVNYSSTLFFELSSACSCEAAKRLVSAPASDIEAPC